MDPLTKNSFFAKLFVCFSPASFFMFPFHLDPVSHSFMVPTVRRTLLSRVVGSFSPAQEVFHVLAERFLVNVFSWTSGVSVRGFPPLDFFCFFPSTSTKPPPHLEHSPHHLPLPNKVFASCFSSVAGSPPPLVNRFGLFQDKRGDGLFSIFRAFFFFLSHVLFLPAFFSHLSFRRFSSMDISSPYSVVFLMSLLVMRSSSQIYGAENAQKTPLFLPEWFSPDLSRLLPPRVSFLSSFCLCTEYQRTKSLPVRFVEVFSRTFSLSFFPPRSLSSLITRIPFLYPPLPPPVARFTCSDLLWSSLILM